MKYIINESQLDKVIFRYLDMELEGKEERKGIHVDIVIGYPGEEYGLVGIKKLDNKRAYAHVSYELIDKIKYLFSMEKSDILDVISRYVGNRYNLIVTHTTTLQSSFMR